MHEQIMRPVAVFVVSVVLLALAAGAALAVNAKNPVLSVIRNPAAIITWTFTTNYTAVFASGELNTQFNDCILLFEHDITRSRKLRPPQPRRRRSIGSGSGTASGSSSRDSPWCS